MKLLYTSNSTFGHRVKGIVTAVTKGMEIEVDTATGNRLIDLGLAEKASSKANAGDNKTPDEKNGDESGKPKYSKSTKKDTLKDLAKAVGITVPDDAKNQDIVDLLDKHYDDAKANGDIDDIEKHQVKCPNCDQEFEIALDDDAGAEKVEVKCPECESDFTWNAVDGEVVEDEGGSTGDAEENKPPQVGAEDPINNG